MKIRSPFLLNLGGWFAAKIVRTLFRTLKFTEHLPDPTCDPRHPDCPEEFLYCFWHEWVLMPIGMCTVDNMSGLVSRHQDGGILAMAMKHLGIRAVRGSSSKGGTRALRELVTAAKDWHIAITPDGPRGPRREIKDGIIYLASQTGNPIVCFGFACKNAWVIRGNWTDLVIPKPFSQIVAYAAPPFRVPPGLDRAEIEYYRRRLQREMDDVDEKIDRELQGTQAAPELRRAA